MGKITQGYKHTTKIKLNSYMGAFAWKEASSAKKHF
jgi:hypothetical protein